MNRLAVATDMLMALKLQLYNTGGASPVNQVAPLGIFEKVTAKLDSNRQPNCDADKGKGGDKILVKVAFIHVSVCTGARVE